MNANNVSHFRRHMAPKRRAAKLAFPQFFLSRKREVGQVRQHLEVFSTDARGMKLILVERRSSVEVVQLFSELGLLERAERCRSHGFDLRIKEFSFLHRGPKPRRRTLLELGQPRQRFLPFLPSVSNSISASHGPLRRSCRPRPRNS